MPQAALTPSQAAFVLGESVKKVSKMLDAHSASREVKWRGGVKVRLLSEQDLVYILAVREAGDDLTPKGRASLFNALTKARRSSERAVDFGALRMDVKRFESDLAQRMARYKALVSEVAPAADGDEPVIKGTSIEAHRISALLDGGMSVEEVLGDYPSLTQAQVESAHAYAVANPKAGRPYPKRSMKGALRDLGLGELNAALAEINDERE